MSTQRRSFQQLSRLDGRVAIITGGAGHIGTAMAETLVELGARVALVDLPGKAEEAARAFGERAIGIAADLADVNGVRTIPAQVAQALGSVDIVVHCAALVGTSSLDGWSVPFLEQGLGAWSKALDVNLSSPFSLTQAATPHLLESKHASVTFISSIYGVVGPDWRLYEGTDLGNPAAYAATKGALVQMTRWLATTLAPKIRVNCISPGGVWRQTPEAFLARYIARTPMQRMATEEDMKGAIAYLASDLSAYVTGQNLMVDGGWTSW